MRSNSGGFMDAWPPKSVRINAEAVFTFEDGTVMSGETLFKYIKILQRIVAKDYPEELL